MAYQQRQQVQQDEDRSSELSETGGMEDFGSNAEQAAALKLASTQTDTTGNTEESQPWWAEEEGDSNTGTASRGVSVEFPIDLPNGLKGSIEILYEVAWPKTGAGSFETFKASQDAKFKADGKSLAASSIKLMTFEGGKIQLPIEGFDTVATSLELGGSKGDLTGREETDWTLAKGIIELRKSTPVDIGGRKFNLRVKLSVSVPMSLLGDGVELLLKNTVEEADRVVQELDGTVDELEKQIADMEAKRPNRSPNKRRALDKQIAALRKKLDDTGKKMVGALSDLSRAENAATRLGGKTAQKIKPVIAAVRNRLGKTVLPKLLKFTAKWGSRLLPGVGWGLLVLDLIDVTRRLYAWSQGDAEFGFGGGDIDQPKLPMSETPGPDATRSEESVPGTERFEKETAAVKRLFDVLTAPGKGSEESQIDAAAVARFFEIVERHRGALTDAKVDRITALIADGTTSSELMLAQLDVLLGLSDDDLAALAPRPGEAKIPMPKSPEALRKRIEERKQKDAEQKNKGNGEGDGKGNGGGNGNGIGSGIPGTTPDAPIPEKVRRLAVLLRVGGADLDEAGRIRLEAMAATATPEQIGAIAALGFVPPKNLQDALDSIAALLALPPDQIRQLGVDEVPGKNGLGGKTGGKTADGTGGGTEAGKGGTGGGTGTLQQKETTSGGGGDGTRARRETQVTMKPVAEPSGKETVSILFTAGVTRLEKVGAPVTITAEVQGAQSWSFTLAGRVTAVTPQKGGKPRITIRSDNQTWLLVTHPKYGPVYVRPRTIIQG